MSGKKDRLLRKQMRKKVHKDVPDKTSFTEETYVRAKAQEFPDERGIIQRKVVEKETTRVFLGPCMRRAVKDAKRAVKALSR